MIHGGYIDPEDEERLLRSTLVLATERHDHDGGPIPIARTLDAVIEILDEAEPGLVAFVDRALLRRADPRSRLAFWEAYLLVPDGEATPHA